MKEDTALPDRIHAIAFSIDNLNSYISDHWACNQENLGSNFSHSELHTILVIARSNNNLYYDVGHVVLRA